MSDSLDSLISEARGKRTNKARAAQKSANEDTVSAAYGKVSPPGEGEKLSDRARARAPASAFKLPAPPAKKWCISASAIRPLPPPGEYDAIISSVSLYDKGDVLWMGVKYELTGEYEGNAPEAEFGAIAALPGSQHEKRVVEGARLLHRTAAAAGVALDPDLDPYDLPQLFEGKEVRLRVAHKTIDGVPALIARRAVPKRVD